MTFRMGILGAGALGSAVGGALVRAGQSAELWDLNQEHIDAINAHGLIFDAADGQHVLSVPACRPEQGQYCDLIILLTKTLHTASAIEQVQHHIAEGAMVLSAQNGLGNATKLAAHVPEDQVAIGCTMMPARLMAPGHVASQSHGKILFRALTKAGEKRAATFEIESDPIKLICDPQEADRVIWQKAAFNCALNSMCALYDGPLKYMDQSADAMTLAKNIASEVVNLAKHQNIPADRDAVFAHLQKAVATNTEHKPSMLQDMEAARPTEIDSLCAEVARQGKDLGVPTPLNTALATLVTLKSAALNGEFA